MSIEAMKQARDFISRLKFADAEPEPEIVMAVLDQAIAEAEKQEPVATCVLRTLVAIDKDGNETWKDEPLYTHPPKERAEGEKREWVVLTMEEIDLLEELYAPPVHPDFANDASHCLELIRHVEAKLKAKNGFPQEERNT